MEGKKFAFLIHPRDVLDVKKNYRWLRVFPNFLIELIMIFLPAQRVDTIIGLKNNEGREVSGELISVFLTARQMLMLPRFFVRWRVWQAVKLAEKRGASIVGLGALTSSVTGGGLDLPKKRKILITNGNAFTAEITIRGIEKAIEHKNKKITELTIAIIGATGSIGVAVSKMIALMSPQKLILIGRTQSSIDNLDVKIKEINPNLELTSTSSVVESNIADVIVMATASQDVILDYRGLKKDAIIYDITQPQNVSTEIKDKRSDILVVDGGLVRTPFNVSYKLDLGLPANNIFACMAETALLAVDGHSEDFSLGKVSMDKVDIIRGIAEKYVFELAPLRSWGEIV